MAFLVSPGVQVQEKDLSNVVPAVATSIGGYAGEFRWGPVGEVVQVSSEVELANIFGKPTAPYARSFLTAASFLKYGNTLKVSRAAGTNSVPSRNAVATYFVGANNDLLVPYSGSAVTIGNGSDYSASTSALSNASFVARYPGQLGASIGVYVVTAYSTGSSSEVNPFNGATLAVANQFDSQPTYSSNNPVIVKATTGSGTQLTIAGNDNGGITAGMFVVGKGINPSTYIASVSASSAVTTSSPSTISSGSIQFTIGLNVFTATSLGITVGTVITASSSGIPAGTTVTQVSGGDQSASCFIRISTATTASISSGSTLSFTKYGKVNLSQSVTAAYSASTLTFFEPDQIHVAVIDLDGGLSGTPGTILEKWSNLSLFADGKRDDGTNVYYKEFINRNSSYVWVNTLANECPNADTTVTSTASTLTVATASLNALAHICGNRNLPIGNVAAAAAYGKDGGSIDGGSWDTTSAIDYLADAETIDVSLLFGSDIGDENGLSTTENLLQSTANTRRDCIAFISAPLTVADKTTSSAKLTAVLNKFKYAIHDSYQVFDSGPLYVYNKYQDNYIWIPACGHVAGLCAYTENVADAWWSPAGYNRGNLKGVTKIAFNPDQSERDALYKENINSIVAFPGQGILLFGDKTGQSKPSAFDRINVRRLFIVLEKAIATAAKYQLFEFNDQFTQAMFRSMTEPFLRDIKGRRGIMDFLVVCDSTNNTPAVVDANQFVADIYVKPARSINFITLNFIATRTGVSFSEIAGSSNA